MAVVRERPLAHASANKFANYMNEMIQKEVAAGHTCLANIYDYANEAKTVRSDMGSITAEDIQAVSMQPNHGLMIVIPETMTQIGYSGSNPYEIRQNSEKGLETIYLDELYERSVVSQQSQKSAEQTKSADQPSVAGASGKPTQLVGVSKNCLRFRKDGEGNEWVNVAVPWSQSKNGLGNLDISRAEFDAANTAEDMKKRKTYHIPLSAESYGLWYIDKNTGKPAKPDVKTSDIYAAYEENRASYRAARVTSATAAKEEAAKQSESLADGVDFDVDDLDFGM